MGGTPYSILDGLRNACQPTRHRWPARTHECRRSHVGIRQGAYDFISSTLDLEPPFTPCRPRALRPRARPDAVYLVPGPHPDCPSCPKSLTRSRRRSLPVLGNNRAAARNANIHNAILSWTRSHIGREPSVLISSPRPLNAVGSLSMGGHKGHMIAVPCRPFRPKLQYVNK